MEFCIEKTLPAILALSYNEIREELHPKAEEDEFILYMEWDALRSAIAQYLGINHPEIDKDRCQITSVEFDETGIAISEVVLPPKELPKILPCSLGDN